MLRKVVQTEANKDMKFKIIEKGGRTVMSLLQRSNPTATAGYTAGDCIACRGENRCTVGNCRRNNVTYEIECRLCQEEDRSVCVGETPRNLYRRGTEHANKYEGGKEDSFLRKHQGRAAVYFSNVTGIYRDFVSRLVVEGVYIYKLPSKLDENQS